MLWKSIKYGFLCVLFAFLFIGLCQVMGSALFWLMTHTSFLLSMVVAFTSFFLLAVAMYYFGMKWLHKRYGYRG